MSSFHIVVVTWFGVPVCGQTEQGASVSDDYDEDDGESEPEPREWLPQEAIEDNYVRRAKPELVDLINSRPADLFYERQLQVRFEKKFYHWITSRAVKELVDERALRSEYLPLAVPTEDGGGPRMRFFFSNGARYWRRKAASILSFVVRYSEPGFNAAVGQHAEMLFDSGLASAGFVIEAREAKEFRSARWEESGHDLDRIYVRDGVAYGAEIKNKLGYPDWKDEIEIKLRMCRHLGLRPLIISRWLPKAWIWEVHRDWGGFCLLFESQLYPFGFGAFAKEIGQTLGLPVACPRSLEEGIIRRFLGWHRKQPRRAV